MNAEIKDKIELLKDYGLLPYATAQAFCYVNFKSFLPAYLPVYKKYFTPFKSWKNNTFYHIGDLGSEMQRYMSNSLLKEAGFNGDGSLAIIHVVIAGLSEAQCDQIVGLDISNIAPLKLDYDYAIVETGSMTLSSNNFPLELTPELFEPYGVVVTGHYNNIVLFTLKIL
jgi:hypothetical protein